MHNEQLQNDLEDDVAHHDTENLLQFRDYKYKIPRWPALCSEHFLESYHDLMAAVCESLMPGKLSPHDWPALHTSVHDTQNFLAFRV